MRIILIFLAFVCFSLYFHSLNNEFLFDERDLIEENIYIQDLRFLPHIFGDMTSYGVNIYRPLTFLLYALGYFFSGLNPAGYHLLSIILYALNCFLIFVFIKLLFRDEALALLTAALFAVHPLHSKEVAVAADAPFVLESVFLLLSLIFSLRYLDRKRAASYLLSLVFFILAVLTRESGLFIPLIIVLAGLIYGADKRRLALSILPFFLLGAAYFLLRQGFVPSEQLKINFAELIGRIPLFFYYCHRYIQQIIILPYGLTGPPAILRLIRLAAAAGALLFYAGAARLIWRKNKVIIFGCVFFLLGILPVLNLTGKIAAYGFIVFDHYGYLASLGIILIFAYFFERLSILLPKTAGAFFITAVFCYSALTVRNTAYYKSQESYYRYILSFDKSCAFAYAGLANIYYQKGMLAEAEEKAAEALSCGNKNAVPLPYAAEGPYTTLGSIYASRGEFDKAISYFEEAVKLKPKYELAYANLALVYTLKDDPKKAYSNFQQAVKLNPACLFALRHFSRFLLVYNLYPEAIDICERILELKPDDADARIVLAEIARKLGRIGESERIYKEAVSINERKNHYQGR